MSVGTLLAALGMSVGLNNLDTSAFRLVVAIVSLRRMRKEEALLLGRLPDDARCQSETPLLPALGSLVRATPSGSIRMSLPLKQCFKNGKIPWLDPCPAPLLASGLYPSEQNELTVDDGVLQGGAVALLCFATICSLMRLADVARRKRCYPIMTLCGICSPLLAWLG